MKRVLTLAVLMALLAGSASADLYTFDEPTAAGLREVSSSDNADITYIGYTPGNAPANKVFGSENFYGDTMELPVGFRGTLSDTTGDGISSILIGAAAGAPALLASIQAAGSFDGFFLPIANDNDDTWQYKLYVDTDAGAGIEYQTAWLPPNPPTLGLPNDTVTSLALFFGTTLDFSHVLDIGFGIQLNRGGVAGDGDEFHTSVVPLPGAVLLGMLGLSYAGMRLRKIA